MSEKKFIDVHVGLTNNEVEKRKNEGFVNVIDNSTTKSYKQIFINNIFTLFNFVNLVLALLIITTGEYKNLLFLGVVFSNIFIGTFQEIRSKITLDKISLIHTMKVCAIRESKETMISINEIVLDDILKIKSGNQIVSDSIVRVGSIEVDESLLTGESEPVYKKTGDLLYSGSFVVSGNATIQVVKVGNDNYASQMVKSAKKYSKYPSELRDTLNTIIKIVSFSIIPLGCIMFYKNYFILEQSLTDSILSMSAALIGMIPEGLVILTSIALAVGVIHLARYKTLVQELYCIETLARVDVLCLDKTGTITEGKMLVEGYHSYTSNFEEIMSNMSNDIEDDNATITAIREYFKPISTFDLVKTIPFNSTNKYSGVIYKDDIYIMGAYNYMMNQIDEDIVKEIEKYSANGYRVISVAKTTNDDIEFNRLEFIGNIFLLDKIREEAKNTLDYFKKQDVDIKIISGDHPLTVSQIAKRVGLENYNRYVDTSSFKDEELIEIVDDYQIFGRVTPNQKKIIIQALKKNGHTVGMSGDGVNDVLAFKEADVSIAMNSGSDIAKSSANLVLLDSNFDALPEVLNEGRRVINNIQRVATLFLTKTVFSILLTLITILLPFEYPFIPIQLTFVSTFTIGIPAFFMAIEPNKKRVENRFLENILKVSLPAGVSVVLSILLIYLLSTINQYPNEIITLLSVITIAINGCIVLTKVSKPYTVLRKVILALAYICILIGLFFGESIINIVPIEITKIYLEVILIGVILFSVSKIGSNFITKMYK